ncbi:type II toxin-antitoxin system Phd/YefM family antitoxin [Streptomyces prunicolor]|uniref:type II toxin-antitoxin system Phd/YefM family antitoxin n=1 Tax=Streptomyces prunicolor TaxID=67348 RepID=UPI000D0A994B|nr:type II toxin-antitoxin system prevent-host-death family antitoxin [Streptomyces prunicolor]
MDESASASVREARADLTRLLDRAAKGEPTVITRGGVPVAANAEIFRRLAPDGA